MLAKELIQISEKPSPLCFLRLFRPYFTHNNDYSLLFALNFNSYLPKWLLYLPIVVPPIWMPIHLNNILLRHFNFHFTLLHSFSLWTLISGKSPNSQVAPFSTIHLSQIFPYKIQTSSQMAPKKSIQRKPSPSTPFAKVSNLIKDCNIPSSIHIRPIIEVEKKRWKIEGLDSSLLVLGKSHIETIRFPLHPMILQILSALQVHLM